MYMKLMLDTYVRIPAHLYTHRRCVCMYVCVYLFDCGERTGCSYSLTLLSLGLPRSSGGSPVLAA